TLQGGRRSHRLRAATQSRSDAQVAGPRARLNDENFAGKQRFLAHPLRRFRLWGSEDITRSAALRPDARDMAEQHLTVDMPRSAVDRTQPSYGGSIALVMLMALMLVAAAAGLLLIGRTNAGPYILGLLSVLSMAGVFLLFAIAAGLLRMPGKETVSPLIKS